MYFLEHLVARSFVQLDQAMFCPKLNHFPIAFWTFSFQYNLYIVKYYTKYLSVLAANMFSKHDYICIYKSYFPITFFSFFLGGGGAYPDCLSGEQIYRGLHASMKKKINKNITDFEKKSIWPKTIQFLPD